MKTTVSTKKYRKITLDMVLASTSLTRSSKETADAYLQRVTHLHLQNKKIRVIEALDQCTNLKVLYLYDNQIELIQNLGFSSILQYLYLHNNLIKEIPNLTLPNLKKLYLDDNEIQTVSGLASCANLEELHIARQRLPSYASLQFQRESLHSISRSLQVLEMSGNGVISLSPFCVLYNLRKLYCQDNKVIDLAEIEMIVALPRLEEANFLGNPCCSQFKYRDTAIGASSDSFQILDELPVPKHQQIAIRGLMAHRRKIGAMSRFQAAINGSSGISADPSQMEYQASQIEYQEQYQSLAEEQYQSQAQDGGPETMEGEGVQQGSGSYYEEKQQD
jgi:Leucine-rich repeat (LRR) protein